MAQGDSVKIAKCKSGGWSCGYEKERDLLPLFIVAGQCPGSKCRQNQAMLYSIPSGSDDRSAIQPVWTKDTKGGSNEEPCKRDSSFPTRSINSCGDFKNVPSANFAVNVAGSYMS